MSCAPAALVRPSTRPVAGLRLSNSSPLAAGTSSPSISIRDSARSAARLPSSTLVSVRSSTSLTCTSYNRTLRDDQL